MIVAARSCSRALSARPDARGVLQSGGYWNVATLFGVRSRLGAVEIEAPANDVEIPRVKWINVANEGEYLGHHQGGFELTLEVMGQLVSNLRAHPKYLVGDVTLPDGSVVQAGSRDVVQYDYEHASEMAPWEGTIPLSGAPAMGWVWDLEIRKGADGRGQLWALSWLGDQIRGQIQRREYKWVSIAWNPSGVHWQTGQPIGAVLTSIAFTNHPFLQDLADLAARAGSGTAGQGPQTRLPFRADQRSGGIRGAGPSNPNQGNTMDLRVRLASLFRLVPEANDDSIIRAAENASNNGGTLAAVLAAFGVSDPQALIGAAQELPQVRQKLADALAELDSLGRADASADEAVAQQDVASALSAAGWARGGMVAPNLLAATLLHRKGMIDAELEKLPKDRRNVGEQRLARERGRQAFLAAYGVNLNPATRHLTQTFVAGPGAAGGSSQFFPALPAPNPGAQLQPLPGAPVPQGQPLQLSALPGAGGAAPEQVDLAAFSGRNPTERVMSYLASQDPGFSKLDRAVQVRRAGEWRRRYEASFGPIAA